jgi:hypothetical protein
VWEQQYIYVRYMDTLSYINVTNLILDNMKTTIFTIRKRQSLNIYKSTRRENDEERILWGLQPQREDKPTHNEDQLTTCISTWGCSFLMTTIESNNWQAQKLTGKVQMQRLCFKGSIANVWWVWPFKESRVKLYSAFGWLRINAQNLSIFFG